MPNGSIWWRLRRVPRPASGPSTAWTRSSRAKPRATCGLPIRAGLPGGVPREPDRPLRAGSVAADAAPDDDRGAASRRAVRPGGAHPESDRLAGARHQYGAHSQRERALVSSARRELRSFRAGHDRLTGRSRVVCGPPPYVWFRNVYGSTGTRTTPLDCSGDRGAGLYPRPGEPAHRVRRTVANDLSSRLLRPRFSFSPDPEAGRRGRPPPAGWGSSVRWTSCTPAASAPCT